MSFTAVHRCLPGRLGVRQLLALDEVSAAMSRGMNVPIAVQASVRFVQKL